MDEKNDLKKMQEMQNQPNEFQDVSDLKIPTPEEFGIGADDIGSIPLPPADAPKEKKGFFGIFKKKEKPQVQEDISPPELPKGESLSFPEFGNNPITPMPQNPGEDTQYLQDEIPKPIEMPNLDADSGVMSQEAPAEENVQEKEKAETRFGKQRKKPAKEESKDVSEETPDIQIDDDETFDSIKDKLDEIESALKKHLDEIEEKMGVVRTIEKELKSLDSKIAKPKKSAKKAAKKVSKKVMKKAKKR